MDSLKQFFSYMNDISYDYVVLRNWDRLPYDVVLGEHSDLDLMVSDFSQFYEIFPQAKLVYPSPRVRTRIPIDDSYIYVDVRSIEDGYYPEDFAKAILSTREWNPKGFFTPNPIHHRIALAYHAVHHKNEIAKEYRVYLGHATEDELIDALKKSEVGWTKPNDPTVGSFHGYWKGCTSVVERVNGNIIKRQTGYSKYNLSENEYNKLKDISSSHFPRVYKLADKEIEIEDCGDSLTVDNLPDDWDKQFTEILDDLRRFSIVHRDIRLENFMVKHGVIKLIDFGWAVYEGELESKPAPSCLGFPNKPSYGFSDAYSIRQVKKQLEYALEEKGVMA